MATKFEQDVCAIYKKGGHLRVYSRKGDYLSAWNGSDCWRTGYTSAELIDLYFPEKWEQEIGTVALCPHLETEEYLVVEWNGSMRKIYKPPYHTRYLAGPFADWENDFCQVTRRTGLHPNRFGECFVVFPGIEAKWFRVMPFPRPTEGCPNYFRMFLAIAELLEEPETSISLRAKLAKATFSRDEHRRVCNGYGSALTHEERTTKTQMGQTATLDMLPLGLQQAIIACYNEIDNKFDLAALSELLFVHPNILPWW